MADLDDGVLAGLRSLDTPTVCNALEIVAPERQGYGFTSQPLVCARPELGSVVGFARTATIRAAHPSDDADEGYARNAYYEYIDAGPKPSVVVIQDLDAEPGYGSFWGEVNSNIHQGLGCRAVVTNGSVRDLPDLADGFQVLAGRVGPSHAFIHVVDFGRPVTVAGMRVADGDLIHADQHGAVVIPFDVAADLPAAADLIARKERIVIEAAQQPGFDVASLRRAQDEASRLK
ncbi:MAG: RraA family protein [Acidimicrobiia bacterium]|nr:RraA family protein [Acidimicrobiia bacterium]